jgi:hypothetical protein
MEEADMPSGTDASKTAKTAEGVSCSLELVPLVGAVDSVNVAAVVVEGGYLDVHDP